MARPGGIDDLLRPGGPARVAAHRGFSWTAPENTLAAFRAALDLGVEMIECDVQLAAGGEPVVIHDDTLERTTDGAGRVERTAWDALRRLDAGGWFARRFSGERVPSLDETLELVCASACLNVEIKAAAVAASGGRVVEAVLDAVARRGAEERVLLSSFAGCALVRARALGSRVALAVLHDRERHRGRTPVELLAELGARAFHCALDEVTAETVRACHARGSAVGVYTANTPRRMRRLLALGVDIVFTDRPDRLLELLRPASDG